MNSKVKSAGLVVLVVALIAGASVASYRKGLSKGYAAMDAMAKIAGDANKASHDTGYYEGKMRGLDEGGRATEADFCGYAEMMGRGEEDFGKDVKKNNHKYASGDVAEYEDLIVDKMIEIPSRVAKEECKHFTAEQIDKFVTAQKKSN